MLKLCALACVCAILLVSAEAHASSSIEDDWVEAHSTEIDPLESPDESSDDFVEDAPGTTVSLVQAGKAWTSFKAGAAAAYAQTSKGLVWAKGKLDGHPQSWAAFKCASAIVTAVFCPLCALVLTGAFAAIDSAKELHKLFEIKKDLPDDLTASAKAACLAVDGTKTLLVVANAVVNVFVPFPLDVAAVGTKAAGEAISMVDWRSVFAAGGNPTATTLAKIADGSVAGYVGEKANIMVDNKIKEIKAGNGVMASIKCSKMAQAADKASKKDELPKSLEIVKLKQTPLEPLPDRKWDGAKKKCTTDKDCTGANMKCKPSGSKSVPGKVCKTCVKAKSGRRLLGSGGKETCT